MKAKILCLTNLVNELFAHQHLQATGRTRKIDFESETVNKMTM